MLGLEVSLVVSLLAGLALARRSALPRELLRTAAELMREEEFGSRLSPAVDPDAAALVALFNRMMERLRQERLTVQERNQLLAEVIDASPAALLTLDHDGRIELANPAAAALLERPASELRGLALAGIHHPVCRQLASLGADETRLLNLQGRRLRAARRRFFDRGFPRSFYLVEELTEELRASERAAYEKLIRLISHEVKNSVGAVGSLLQSTAGIASELPPERGARAARALGVAEDRLRNLDRFVDGFADVVRLPPPDRRPVDLAALLDDLLTLLEPEIEQRRVLVRRPAPPEGLPPVSADKNQLEQALVNILRNALEAIGEAGELRLSLSRTDREIALTVGDTGPGIAEEVRSQLFVPFFSTKRDGRGLGLTLIREILEAHRFRYALETREGGGAEFHIAFPLAPRADHDGKPASKLRE